MNLFTIKNLVCSYDRIHPILYIEDITIPAGEICVLFGKSGSGKSTMLETLGLMTNTIATTYDPYKIISKNEDVDLLKKEVLITFYGYRDNGTVEQTDYIKIPTKLFPVIGKNGSKTKRLKHFHSVWKNHKMQQNLRDEYFAFIFQDTNLMPNFSAEENVAIPDMIALKEIRCSRDKSKCPFKGFNGDCDLSIEKCSIAHARQTLVKNVQISEDKFKQPVRELSGGQRQRIAFARAKNSRFSVLFGDEPTGNLDFINSKGLMKVISDLIESDTTLKRSAIIVSHDINLTLRFANRIIFIETRQYEIDKLAKLVDENDKDRLYGKIDCEMVYVCKDKADLDNRRWHLESQPDKTLEMEEMKQILIDYLIN